MSLVVNLRHLAVENLLLQGELSIRELEIDTRDEMLRIALPVWYDLEVQKLEESLLVRGRLRVTLDCQCVRCLKPFQHRLELEAWTRHLDLEGEERVAVDNDCVDLTPHIREDILLELPRHPLCSPECPGVAKAYIGKPKPSSASQTESTPSAWAVLDKLKF
jgi:uncharacterized metal-binding protein YceD (DUF177 family)